MDNSFDAVMDEVMLREAARPSGKALFASDATDWVPLQVGGVQGKTGAPGQL